MRCGQAGSQAQRGILPSIGHSHNHRKITVLNVEGKTAQRLEETTGACWSCNVHSSMIERETGTATLKTGSIAWWWWHMLLILA